MRCWSACYLLLTVYIVTGNGLCQSTIQADFNAGAPLLTSEVTFGNNLSLNFASSAVQLSVPVVKKSGKIPFSYALVDNSHIYQTQDINGNSYWNIYSSLRGATNPRFNSSRYATDFTTLSISNIPHAPGTGPCVWSFIEGNGTAHSFPGLPNPGPPFFCAQAVPTTDLIALDSSGFTLHESGAPLYEPQIIDKSGNVAAWVNYQYDQGCSPIAKSGTNTFTDPDQVVISDDFSYAFHPPNSCFYYGETDIYKDQMSSTPILTAYEGYANNPPNPYQGTYTYTDATGASQQYAVKYKVYTLQTNFNCPGVQDIQTTPNTFYLPYEIDLPQSLGTYTIQYESQLSGTVTGRIYQVTNPAGGTVSFQYSGGHNGIDCNAAVAPLVTVKVDDGQGNVGTWAYQNNNTNSGPGNFYVVVTDPLANQTVHFFSGNTNSASYLGGVFPTEVQSYQGSAPANPVDLNTGQSEPGLLAFSKICYNGNFSNCAQLTTPLSYPIYQKDTYQYPVLAGSHGGTIQSPSLTETKFDYNSSTGVTYGNVVAVNKWDFGATNPPSNTTVSTSTTTYGTWNGANCGTVATYIVDSPCETQVGNLANGALTNITAHSRHVYDSQGHLTQTYDYPGNIVIPPGQAWQANTYYSQDGVVIATSANGGDLWQVTVAGLGGSSSEPFTSGHSVGDTITDNQVTWTMIEAAASLTWQPHTPYDPNRQVNGKMVGQYIVTPTSTLTGNLFKLLPTSTPTIIQQPATHVPNMSTNDYVDVYLFDTSSVNNPGIWTYDGSHYTTNNLAGQAKDELKLNSVLFNVGRDPSQQPMENFQLNQSGEISGMNPFPAQYGSTHYSSVVLYSLNVPAAGEYTILINHDDGMLFGIQAPNPSQQPVLISGPTQTYESLTAMNSYPVLGGVNQDGFWSDTYVISFPAPGQYNMEVDYFQWESNQTLVMQMGLQGQSNLYSPIPIANNTALASMTTAPTWPAWTPCQPPSCPSYPAVAETGTYSWSGGQYRPTGGALTWENHGPVTDFVWRPNKSFTLPNTVIIDPTGNKQAPYRTGYSGASEPAGFALTRNHLTPDNPYLTWINQGSVIGLITSYSYNAYGVLSQVTDPAGNSTSYSNFACGALLPQTVTDPPNAAGTHLTTNIGWKDCNTAIVHTITDANGNTETWDYADPLIRPTKFTDQNGTQTNTSYTTTTVESVMNFNGGSTTVAATPANPPQSGVCYGPFPGFTCDTQETFGTWANPGFIGSTTNAASVTTDQYDSSATILATSVNASLPQVLTVTMSGALPNTFNVGSWVMVQNTQEPAVNSTGFIYKVLSVNGATFTAAVCTTGEPNCPTIAPYTNNNDTGLVKFNNFFSWNLSGTNLGFSQYIPASSTITGISFNGTVKTSCTAGTCQTGAANGQPAPYIAVGLVGCPTCNIGTAKVVQIPTSGTTNLVLGGQNDLWGASSSALATSVVNSSNFGVSIQVVQPDLGGGPDGQMTWAVNSVTVAVTYQAAGGTQSTNDVITYLDGFGRTYLTQTREGMNSSTWDTVETDYNALGQVTRSTIPFQGSKGVRNPSAPATTYQYDAMGRMTSSTDSETPQHGEVTYAYNAQDVLVTLLPKSNNNENVKTTQLEYDGLDRLTSVCEVTQGYSYWPGVSCNQVYSQTGYLTSYSYDTSNRLNNIIQNNNTTAVVANISQVYVDSNHNLTVTMQGNNPFQKGQSVAFANTNESFLNGQTLAVTGTVGQNQFTARINQGQFQNQNDQGTATLYTQQKRSAAFDQVGRLTTLNDAETGASTLIYDTAIAPCPAYFSAGDLMQKTDAMGNTTCFTYDALHRVVSSNTVSGPYATNTPGKFFVYDTASVRDPANASYTAVALNGAGQLAAAFTCSPSCPRSGTSPGSSVQTTEVFSYDALQRPTTLYESSWTSNPFMITHEAYFPNGEINYLGITTQDGQPPQRGYPGTSGFYYSLDGMGRVNGLTSFVNNVPNTIFSNLAYQPATSLPQLINYVDGDNDAYTYDQNTLRLQSYQFTIGGSQNQYLGGQLTWNPNGSLGQLNLRSTISNTGLTFPNTCTYQYDDLLRMNSEQCTAYSQSTLSFDPFGNPTNTTQNGHPTNYQSMTFDPQNNQITSLSGCSNCLPPFHDANGNQVTDQWLWDADGNFFGNSMYGQSYGYDAFDRPLQSGFLYGGNPMFYRPDGAFLLNTGNTWPNYWAINHMRLPVPGGNDVEVTQSCNYYYCGDNQKPYPYVYAIRHSDQHGSDVLGTCADNSSKPICTYNSYMFLHVFDAFGNESSASTNQEPGSYDGALGELTANAGNWIFPTRQYLSTETRFIHPEGHGNVDLSDPQSWNSFAYTGNNPLVFRDPLGTQYQNSDNTYIPSFELYLNFCSDPTCGGYYADILPLTFSTPTMSNNAPSIYPQMTYDAGAVLGGAGQVMGSQNFTTGMAPFLDPSWSLSWQLSASTSFFGQEVRGVWDVTGGAMFGLGKSLINGEAEKNIAMTAWWTVTSPGKIGEAFKEAGSEVRQTTSSALSGDPRAIGQVVGTAASLYYTAENVRIRYPYKNTGGGGLVIRNAPTAGSNIRFDIHPLDPAGPNLPHVDITVRKPFMPSGPGSNLFKPISHWPWK